MINERIFLSNYSKKVQDNFLNEIFLKLNDLSSEYPNFKFWYENILIPEFHSSKREIVVVQINKEIAGVSILKNSDEKKISTLRVCPEYKNIGIGKILFESSFEYLRTEKPIITVSENKIFEFKRILNYYNFSLIKKYNNYYSKGKIEFAFNGLLNENSKTLEDNNNFYLSAK